MLLYKDETLSVARLVLPPWDANCYLVACAQTGQALLVDAPAQPEQILAAASGLHVATIVITHAHHDHVMALADVQSALLALVAAHPPDALRLPVPPQVMLEDGQELDFGNLRARVIHTPGHTPGSVCLLVGSHLLAGDTLFPGGPGHTNSPAELEVLLQSLATKLFVLADETVVYPGHGEGTTIGRERRAFESFIGRPRRPDLCGDILWESA
jgi:hydroxyacylglutathione hydrolase